MKVRMIVTAASPEKILRAGLCYNLPKEEAERYLKGGRMGHNGPTLPAAELAPPGAKIEHVPATPDPEEHRADNFGDDMGDE